MYVLFEYRYPVASVYDDQLMAVTNYVYVIITAECGTCLTE
jgi:hypothetical protein